MEGEDIQDQVPGVLACDVGNSGVHFAHVCGDEVSDIHVMRMDELARLGDELAVMWEAMPEPKEIVAGSVNEAGLRALEAAVTARVGKGVLCIGRDLPLPIATKLPHPKSIGVDRLCAAVAAFDRLGVACVVADFGTALTFDIITADRRYVGGVIAPGLPVMTDYLFERTALLPRLKLGGTCPRIGRSTRGAMRIGAHIGYRGMVREIVNHLRLSLRGKVHLCATGGYARWAIQGLDMPFVIDPTLTLFGLGCIFEAHAKRPHRLAR